jgi:hypothetical protein
MPVAGSDRRSHDPIMLEELKVAGFIFKVSADIDPKQGLAPSSARCR